jgi:ATP-dependent helicase/nuclease subunit B
MAGLAQQTEIAPVLVVDSPFAVQSIKRALASADWPGRAKGAPLPWCGSLEQGFEALVSDTLSDTVPDTFPRSLVVRRVQLAQQLLDHPGLWASLGGSAKAALDLAAQWVEIFEGWEWLDLGSSATSAPSFEGQIGSDVQTLRALQKENQQRGDRAFWAQEHAAKRALHGQQEVWFCMGRTPSDLELAIAKTMWGASNSTIRVFTLELPAELPTPGATRQLICAQSLEEAAWSAAQVILQWRRQGLNDIGVVPLDRKVVRRLRALLDRAGEPFSDRSGWSLDTTVAATALSGLSDLLCGRGTTQSLLEWVHSPFVARALRRQFEFGQAQREALDSVLRSYGRIAPVSLAALFTQELLPQAMQGLLPLCDDKRAALTEWSNRLLSALEICGLEEALASDAAGQSVIAALQILAAESANSAELVSAALWQSVLAECLSQSRFAEPPSEAAVRVCSLSSLLWRLPQAVLVIGAQAGRLPQPVVPRFFEPKRFAEMGLQADPEQLQGELFAQFVAAWAASFPMAMIACSEKPDAEVEFSGWIELLALRTHKAIERVNACDFVARRELVLENFSSEVSLQAQFEGSLPESFSVSSLQSLANCSLQFYWQTLRGLVPTQPLEEEASPSDLGSLLHLVLRGAIDVKASASEWEVWLEKEIDRVLATPFFQKRRDKKLLLPMPTSLRASLRADAMAVVPALAGWLDRHGPSGLAVTDESRHCEEPTTTNVTASEAPRSIITEQPVSRVLQPFGITIKGQIDRIEAGNEGARLIDFKTTNPTELKRRLKTIEDDVQLALYAWMLSPQKIESATYVSIRREGVEDIGVASSSAESLEQRVEATLAVITEKLQAIVNGEPIEAEGVSKHKSICERCLVRGICRRDDLLVPNGEEEESE